MKASRKPALTVMILSCFFLLMSAAPAPASGQAKAKAEWLPLCGKCLKPSIFEKSGIGTAHAVAKARITLQDAKEHCESFSMSATPDCDKQAKETLKEENGKIYQAIADCVHGKITLATGDNLTYAGIWPSGYLKGKTRWRFVSSGYDNGKFANEDGPVNGFMVDTTSKILCPNGVGANRRR